MRFNRLLTAVLSLFLLAGCGDSQWKISVRNDSKEPCSVDVTMGADSNSHASTAALKPGDSHTLIAGSGDTILQSVKVVRGADEKVLTPKTPLRAGRTCNIVISADGTVTAATPE